ncbi:MAG TPA: FecR domain-containing protein [Candidatus Sulfotelmatobacter sp.]|nr:FecR domain-containing protein [Candidatus Sulfotelmatobacter sp.]
MRSRFQRFVIASGAVLAATAGSALAAGPQQAGVSAAVRGEIRRINAANPVGVRLASGQPIYLADRIDSGPASGLQIMLLDQTTFTIGPDSSVTIDQFVYDPTTSAGRLTASIGKGVFRFVSGKIAQHDPASMTVKLPLATIGIRGTMVFGRSDGKSAIVGLAGPGPENNTGDKTAGVDVITADGTAELRRPGWGAIVTSGRPPLLQQLPRALVEQILNQVAPRALAGSPSLSGASGSRQPGNGAPPVGAASTGQAAGQASATALVSLASLDKIAPLTQNADQATLAAVQLGDNGINTTMQQLLLQTGFGFYALNNISLTGSAGSGSYNFSMQINFDTRQINVQYQVNSFIFDDEAFVPGSLSFSQSYAGASGPATFSGSGSCVFTFSCQGSVSLKNVNGVAGQADFSLSVGAGSRSSSGAGSAAKQTGG